MFEHIRAKGHIPVNFVQKHLQVKEIYKVMSEHILAKDHIHV